MFDLEVKLDYDVVRPSERDQNVRGYMRAQTRANKQFLTAAADAIRTGWKPAVMCYRDFARSQGLEEKLKAMLDKSEESEDEQLSMKTNGPVAR